MPEPRRVRCDFAALPRVAARGALGKRVVGFDVFDTLLRRRVEPEYVKDLVARELARRLAALGIERGWHELRRQRRELELALGRESEAAGGDHEFRLRPMLADWIAPHVEAARAAPLAAELAAFELRLEHAATFPTPGIRETLTALAARVERLVFVTDNYLDLDDIRSLLRRHGLERLFHAGYCSSNVLRTKRTGRLFEHVLASEQVDSAGFLFVGDNPHSDIAPARRLGIDTVLLHDAAEWQRRKRLHLLHEFNARSEFWRAALEDEIVRTGAAALLPADGPRGRPAGARPALERRSDPHRELGMMLAPIFLAFTRDILRQARELQLERLYFLSREGWLLMRLYRRIVRAAGLRDTAPPATYLAASRSATFLPSMHALNWPELERMWRQYANQSLRQMLRNLCLPQAELLPVAASCGLRNADEPIDEAHENDQLHAFLEHPDTQRVFTHHRDAARNALADYLRRKHFFAHHRVGFVDVGWKGSIQDNLIRAVRAAAPGGPDVHGLYLALVDTRDDPSARSYKHAYLADARRDDWPEQVIFRNGSIFEMFASAPHGVVTGYIERRPGHPAARTTPAPLERRNHRTVFRPVFEAIESYTRNYLAALPLLDAGPGELRPGLLDRLRRYVLYPTLPQARAFLAYSHVESFGVHGVTTYEFKGSWRQILFGGSPLGALHRLITSLERHIWAEAILRRSRIPLANFLYDLLQTRYAARQLPT